MRYKVSAESIILVAICTADMLLTAYAVTAGFGTEQNPLMAACLERGVWTFIGVKTQFPPVRGADRMV
jgi:hypothetical protein